MFKRGRATSNDRDRGSIAIIFAVLLGTGALLGLIAMGFDMGMTYLEQQTLREASGAASQSLARACAIGAPQCASPVAARALVTQVLNANSADGYSGIDEVCGSSPLTACATLTNKTQDCQTANPGVNFVRVTAKSADSAGHGIKTVFSNVLDHNFNNTDPNGLVLWQCSQAIWVASASSSTSNISFNVLLPACDYPGNSNSVVLVTFQDQGNNPSPPRTTSCTQTRPTVGDTVTLTNVTNGWPPFTASVGACDSSISLSVGSVVYDNTLDRKFCGGDNTALMTFLNSRISSGTPIRVAMAGTFANTQANRYDITVIGFSDFKFLGYRLTNSQQGGATPPGGWASYPAGLSGSGTCKASNPCLYGQYTTVPTHLQANFDIKIVP